jgi:polysaccharide biosynthesis transport protein
MEQSEKEAGPKPDIKENMTFADYYYLLIRRRWILIAAALATVIVTGLYMLLSPAQYESSANFMLESKEMAFLDQGLSISQQTRPLEYYQAMMKSRVYHEQLLQAVIAEKAFVLSPRKKGKDLLKIIRKNITLTASEYADFIQLKVRTHDPNLTYRLAVLATDFLKERCQQVDREDLQNAVNFIESQKQAAKVSLEETERTLQEFKEKANLSPNVEKDGGLVQQLVNLEDLLTAAETEKQLAEANLASYKNRLSQIESKSGIQGTSLKSPMADQYRLELSDLERQRNDLMQGAARDTAKVRDLGLQIEAKKKVFIGFMLQSSEQGSEAGGDNAGTMWKNLQERSIAEELNVFVLQNRVLYYQKMIDMFRRRHPNLMNNAIELLRLTRAQTVSENLYNFLLQRGEESKIQAASGTGGIRIVDAPVPPTEPVPYDVARNLTLSLLAGLGLGFILVVVRERLDNSIRGPDDVAACLNLPLMGMIPAAAPSNGTLVKSIAGRVILANPFKSVPKKKHDGKPSPPVPMNWFLISDLRPKDPVVESYRTLRSNLQFAGIDHPNRSIMISSPNPSDGKTLTAANLSISFAMLGMKILLVDADLRKPQQHRIFQIREPRGLTECLVENLPVDKVMYDVGITNLRVIPCGKMPPNPVEILSSRRMKDVIAQLEKTVDLVIFDSPPIIPVADPVILGSKLDGILLVVKQEVTNRYAAQEALRKVLKAKGNVLGVILNYVRMGKGYGAYYPYYDKGYY